MNSAVFVALPIAAFTAAIMFLLPHISPQRYFFAITVAPDFPSSEAGRKILNGYHVRMACIAAVSAAVVIGMTLVGPAPAMIAAMAIPSCAGFASFLRARDHVRCYSESRRTREADLSTTSDHLPRWVLLALPPFAGPVIAATWLRAHWNDLPERFPVHWDLAGQPNRWADKTTRGVYGPLLFEAGMMLLVLLLTLAMFYGARRGPQRLAVLKIQVATLWFLAYAFTLVGLAPMWRLPPLAMIVPTALFMIAVIAWCYRFATDPSMPVDPTPDRYWHLGSIYYNRQDPAIFVQRRVGFGYTLNFGNHLSWLTMGLFTAGVLGLTLVLR